MKAAAFAAFALATLSYLAGALAEHADALFDTIFERSDDFDADFAAFVEHGESVVSVLSARPPATLQPDTA